MLKNWQHLRSILTAILLLLAVSLGSFAQSQQPLSTSPESSQQTKADAGTSGQPAPESERKAEARTLPATPSTPATKAPHGAAKKQEERNESPTANWLLVIFSWAIAVFTFALARSTIGLHKATRLMAGHMVASERAYITMSHTPPGLILLGLSGQMEVTIQVRNAGRTPATISNLVIMAKALPHETPLPEEPDYGQEQDEPTAKAFMATDGSFDHTRSLSVSSSELVEVKRRSKTLYIIGYVDYIDQFEQRHRSGYARQYNPQRDQNNLIFVTQRGYNYDRPRKKGEGFDWENTGLA